MKIKITPLLFFLVLSCHINFAQQWQWSKFLDQNVGPSAEMVTDNAGNFYLKTATGTAVVFEGIPINQGAFIAKFNSAGIIQWAKNVPNAGKIKFNHQNILCVTGYFTNTCTLGAFSATSNGGSDIYIAQMDQSGAFTSLKTFGGPGNDKGFGIDIGSDDRIFITGSFEDSVMFGSAKIKNVRNTQGFYAACVDAALNAMWAVGDTLTAAVGYDIASDANNNSYVWGQAMDTACFMYCDREFISRFDNTGVKSFSSIGGQDGSLQNLEITNGSLFRYGYNCNHQYCSAFIMDCDMQLNVKWAPDWFDTYSINMVHGILSDTKESTVAGSYGSWAVQGSVQIDSIWVPLKGSNSDLIVTKMDSTGHHMWFKTAGGYGDEVIQAIAADGAGNYFVFGWLSNSSGRPDTLIMDNDTLIGNSTPYQYFIARLIAGGTTDISSHSKTEQFAPVYPNPSTGKFSITTSLPHAITIYNLYGETLPFNQVGNEIELRDQPAGIYLVEIKYPARSEIKKLILNK